VVEAEGEHQTLVEVALRLLRCRGDGVVVISEVVLELGHICLGLRGLDLHVDLRHGDGRRGFGVRDRLVL
jgi:hypothetical protein